MTNLPVSCDGRVLSLKPESQAFRMLKLSRILHFAIFESQCVKLKIFTLLKDN